MHDEPKPNRESELIGVSIRGWLVTIFALTLCLREISIVVQYFLLKQPIANVQEPFYSIVLFVVGFYFGQKDKGGK